MKFLLAMSFTAVAASAQTPNSVAFLGGFRLFGTRLTLPGKASAYEYANSIEFEIRGEKSLSRRFGVMLAGQFAPNSAQKTVEGFTGIFRSVKAYGGELGLSFRFKPRAPIYFFAGASFMRFSLSADRQETNSPVNEWGTALGIGIDRTVAGEFNARFQVALNLMQPSDPHDRVKVGGLLEPSPDSAKPTTRDWRIGVGVRRTFKQK